MICYNPANAAHPAKYDGPCDAHNAATTTEHAPDAEEQIPARPPNRAAKNPNTTVVHRPTNGETPATNENETASGTMAKETAKPAVMAVRYCVRKVGLLISIFLPKLMEICLAIMIFQSISG